MADQGEIFDETAGLTLRRVARAEHTPLGWLQGAGAGHLEKIESSGKIIQMFQEWLIWK